MTVHHCTLLLAYSHLLEVFSNSRGFYFDTPTHDRVAVDLQQSHQWLHQDYLGVRRMVGVLVPMRTKLSTGELSSGELGGQVQAGVAHVWCGRHSQGDVGSICNPDTMSPGAGHALILGCSDFFEDEFILLGQIHLSCMVLQYVGHQPVFS